MSGDFIYIYIQTKIIENRERLSKQSYLLLTFLDLWVKPQHLNYMRFHQTEKIASR